MQSSKASLDLGQGCFLIPRLSLKASSKALAKGTAFYMVLRTLRDDTIKQAVSKASSYFFEGSVVHTDKAVCLNLQGCFQRLLVKVPGLKVDWLAFLDLLPSKTPLTSLINLQQQPFHLP